MAKQRTIIISDMDEREKIEKQIEKEYKLRIDKRNSNRPLISINENNVVEGWKGIFENNDFNFDALRNRFKRMKHYFPLKNIETKDMRKVKKFFKEEIKNELFYDKVNIYEVPENLLTNLIYKEKGLNLKIQELFDRSANIEINVTNAVDFLTSLTDKENFEIIQTREGYMSIFTFYNRYVDEIFEYMETHKKHLVRKWQFRFVYVIGYIRDMCTDFHRILLKLLSSYLGKNIIDRSRSKFLNDDIHLESDGNTMYVKSKYIEFRDYTYSCLDGEYYFTEINSNFAYNRTITDSSRRLLKRVLQIKKL